MEAQYNLRSPAVKRLMKEAQELREATEQFYAQPLDDNLFEWHFTIRGPADSEFDGGIYHGRIILPPEYPMKPPSIILLTPNGRFETHKKICLSISGYHPETWQPSWSLRTALLAIIGFMPSHGNGAIGSLDYTADERKIMAKKSTEWKCEHCGPIRSLVQPVTEASQALSKEAKELGSQINLQGEKEKPATSDAPAADSTNSPPSSSSLTASPPPQQPPISIPTPFGFPYPMSPFFNPPSFPPSTSAQIPPSLAPGMPPFMPPAFMFPPGGQLLPPSGPMFPYAGQMLPPGSQMPFMPPFYSSMLPGFWPPGMPPSMTTHSFPMMIPGNSSISSAPASSIMTSSVQTPIVLTSTDISQADTVPSTSTASPAVTVSSSAPNYSLPPPRTSPTLNPFSSATAVPPPAALAPTTTPPPTGSAPPLTATAPAPAGSASASTGSASASTGSAPPLAASASAASKPAVIVPSTAITTEPKLLSTQSPNGSIDPVAPAPAIHRPTEDDDPVLSANELRRRRTTPSTSSQHVNHPADLPVQTGTPSRGGGGTWLGNLVLAILILCIVVLLSRRLYLLAVRY